MRHLNRSFVLVLIYLLLVTRILRCLYSILVLHWKSNVCSLVLDFVFILVFRVYGSLHVRLVCIYEVYVRTENWDVLTNETKQNPPQGDDTGTAEATNAGSGGASQVRHVQQSAPRGVYFTSIKGVYIKKTGLIHRMLGAHVEHYLPCTEGLSMWKPNTKPWQGRDPPRSITPFYGSRPRKQVRKDYPSQWWCAYCRFIRWAQQVPGIILYEYLYHVSSRRQIYRFLNTIQSSSLASLHTMQVLLVLGDTERSPQLTPATMGALPYILTFPSP